MKSDKNEDTKIVSLDTDEEFDEQMEEMNSFFNSFFMASAGIIISIIFFKLALIVGLFTVVYLFLEHFGVIIAGVPV